MTPSSHKNAENTEKLYKELLSQTPGHQVTRSPGHQVTETPDGDGCRVTGDRRIAFLLSQFPETHETFILREFVGMKNAGMDFEIYSLKRCRDAIVHPEAEGFIARTTYPSMIGPVSSMQYAVCSPIKFLKAYGVVLRHILNPLNFLKANVVFVRSLYFARLMKKNNIGHIHAHWATMPTTSAEIISTLLDIPFSFTAHAWDIFLSKKQDLKKKIKKAQYIITCTRYNRHYVKGNLGKELGEKFIVNYHGLDLEEFQMRKPRPREDNLILGIGRLVEQKGFEYLIKACGILKRKAINFHCVIVGDGPWKQGLGDRVLALGLKDNVTFIGSTSQEQIKDLLNKASVFAAPCVVAKNGDRDGIPNVILEAMASGVPVVATNVSGLPEVIVDNQTGLVAQPKDPMTLAKAIEKVLKKDVCVDRLTANARRLIEREFDIRKNAEELINILGK